jgi:Rab GDP dissociation inhibitor
VSTTVETDNPSAELKIGLDLLGPIVHKAEAVHDVFEPVIKGETDGLYCSASYDPTTHFETTIAEVLDLFKEITGSPVNFETEPAA